ncbi:MAG: cysteine desulfurase-like protein [Bacillota bacterium]|nr:cysteine desulfurase-like protein [Bacillota bacterium]
MNKSILEVDFPIGEVRSLFPALNRTYNTNQVAYFDGPGGSQVALPVIQAMTNYMTRGGANLHGVFQSSIETEEIIANARRAIADLLGAKAEEVAFGANMTTLAFAIARALGRGWKQGDEIVVTEIDHRANVDPWRVVAEELGMTVRWIKVNKEELALDTSDLHAIITEKTKLVAIGLASNGIGTINDVGKIAAVAKQVGALVAVDAVHAVPHIPIDRDHLGADILLCSAYKFFGPHVGIAVIRSELFEQLNTYRLAPAPSYFPDKLETGTQNHEGIAGIEAAVQFMASLGHGDNRRARILSGIERIEAYENSLANKMRKEMATINGLKLFQAGPAIRKTPTISFQIDGRSPREVCQLMADKYGIFIADGDFYATTLANMLGIQADGGWIRAGLAPYNTKEEVDRFLLALVELT